MKAPDEMPDTVVALKSRFSLGKNSSPCTPQLTARNPKNSVARLYDFIITFSSENMFRYDLITCQAI